MSSKLIVQHAPRVSLRAATKIDDKQLGLDVLDTFSKTKGASEVLLQYGAAELLVRELPARDAWRSGEQRLFPGESACMLSRNTAFRQCYHSILPLDHRICGRSTTCGPCTPASVERLTCIATLSNLAASSVAFVRPHLIERGATEALMAVLMEAESQQTWTHQNLAMHALTNLSAQNRLPAAPCSRQRGSVTWCDSPLAPRAHLEHTCRMTVRLVQVTAVLRMSPHQPFALHLILSLSSDTSTAPPRSSSPPRSARSAPAAAARGDGQALALQATVNLSCSGAGRAGRRPPPRCCVQSGGFQL